DLVNKKLSPLLLLALGVRRWADKDNARLVGIAQVDRSRRATIAVTAHHAERHLHEEGCRAGVAETTVGVDELRSLGRVDFRAALLGVAVQCTFQGKYLFLIVVHCSDDAGGPLRALCFWQCL